VTAPEKPWTGCAHHYRVNGTLIGSVMRRTRALPGSSPGSTRRRETWRFDEATAQVISGGTPTLAFVRESERWADDTRLEEWHAQEGTGSAVHWIPDAVVSTSLWPRLQRSAVCFCAAVSPGRWVTGGVIRPLAARSVWLTPDSHTLCVFVGSWSTGRTASEPTTEAGLPAGSEAEPTYGPLSLHLHKYPVLRRDEIITLRGPEWGTIRIRRILEYQHRGWNETGLTIEREVESTEG
jgi:hypothetical protein